MWVWGFVVSALAQPLPELAADGDFEDVAEALVEVAAERSKGKRKKALAGLRLEEVETPVSLRAGAELSLTAPDPVMDCRFLDSVVCPLVLEAQSAEPVGGIEVSCRTSSGASLALEARDTGHLSWELSGMEACWGLGRVTVVVTPRASAELEGIGEGTDTIPPERVALTWEQVEGILVKRLKGFQHCAVRLDPRPRGKIELDFHIHHDGSVDKVEVLKSSVESPVLEACVAERFRRIHFPRPLGGFTGGTWPLTFN